MANHTLTKTMFFSNQISDIAKLTKQIRELNFQLEMLTHSIQMRITNNLETQEVIDLMFEKFRKMFCIVNQINNCKLEAKNNIFLRN